MGVEIDEMTVEVDDARPDRVPAAPTPSLPVDALLRQVLAALAEEEVRRQRLISD
jgi:hypothetical protein